MEKVIDEGYQEGKDLWKLLIQGPANAHIHEDLQLHLQLQRNLLCFPPRMPSSTPNFMCFLLFISSTPPVTFFPTHFFRIYTPPNPYFTLPVTWQPCFSYLFICVSSTLSCRYPFCCFPPSSPTHSVSLSGTRLVWIWTVCSVKHLADCCV